MPYPVINQPILIAGNSRQRNPAPVTGDNLQLLQYFRLSGVAGHQLHNNTILVLLIVQGGHLTLRKRIVKHRGHSAHVYSQPLSCLAVDMQFNLLCVFATWRINIDQERQFLQFFADLFPH